MTGGAALVRALLDQGVERVFTLCGNHLLAVYDAALDLGGDRLKFTDVRHEGSAAHMADAWARVTGRPGVCLLTGGPGHTNAVTGIATAWAADSPVIWLSGASEYANRGMGAMQEVDQVGIAQPITKWSYQVTDIHEIPSALARAFQIAQTGRPGPVHLSLPVDIVDASADESAIPFPSKVDWKTATSSDGNRTLVEQALDLLASAERPVIVAGAGAWWSGAGEAIRALVEKTGLPVFTMDTARGIISDEHPLCFGYADPVLNPAAKCFAEADVVLLLGRRLDFRLRYGGVFAPDAKLIQVDAEPTDLGRNRAAEIAIAGNVAMVTEMMVDRAANRSWSAAALESWTKSIAVRRAAAAAERLAGETSDQAPLHPLRICKEVRDVLGDDYVLTFDAGDFIQWARQDLPARRPNSWLRLGSMATLGCAIPFAIAAKLARPSANVVALTGDGGVGFYGYEFDTAVRHDVAFTCVVANDAAWGMEKNLQIGIYGKDRLLNSVLRPTRYDKVVEALGGYGEHVANPAELRPALERAIAANRPALVDVESACLPSSQTDASVARKVARK
jgi:acetolactate synthase-1/2/3 large subunit